MNKNIKKIYSNVIFGLKFGYGFWSKLHIIFITFLFPTENVFRKKRKQSVTLSLKFNGKQFKFFVRDSSDVAVLKEVFLFGEYNLNLEREPKMIVDLGSNVGASVAYFALKYPHAQILAVEADPTTVKFLVENTRQFPMISVCNYAVSNSSGFLTFYIHPYSRMSSSLVRRADNQEAIQVPAITFKELLKKEKIVSVDLLKFDIEGAEAKAFSEEGTLSLVEHLVGEIHLDLVEETEEDVWKCFKEFSYRKEAISKNRFIIRGTRKI